MASLNVAVVWHQQGAMQKRLKEIAGRVDPRSRKMDRLRTDLKKIAVEDNTEKLLGYGGVGMLAGVDKYGKQLVRLGEWATGRRVFDKRGHGPVLAPHGLLSRAITRFQVNWIWTSNQYHMWCGWKGSDIKWMIHHLTGGGHLPRRDIGGISPRGMVQARARFRRFARTIPTDDA